MREVTREEARIAAEELDNLQTWTARRTRTLAAWFAQGGDELAGEPTGLELMPDEPEVEPEPAVARAVKRHRRKPEIYQAALAMRRAGMTHRQICSAMGVGVSTARRILLELDHPDAPVVSRLLTAKDEDRIRARLTAGEDADELAAEYEVSHSTIRHVMVRGKAPADALG